MATWDSSVVHTATRIDNKPKVPYPERVVTSNLDQSERQEPPKRQ